VSDIQIFTSEHFGDVHLTVIVNGDEKARVRLTENQIVLMEEHFNASRRYRISSAAFYDPIKRGTEP